jgi:hypothetical protein
MPRTQITNPPPRPLAIDLTAQSAAIGATNIIASTPAAGTYLIEYSAKVTTVDTTSSVLGGANGFQIIYTDPDSVATTTPQGPSNSANTTQAQINGSIIVNVKAATALQYSIGYTGVTGDMRYNLHVRVIFLG